MYHKNIPRCKILLILDNAKSHNSAYSKINLEELNIKIHFNAPGSPELNFIENVFNNIKKCIRDS